MDKILCFINTLIIIYYYHESFVCSLVSLFGVVLTTVDNWNLDVFTIIVIILTTFSFL